MRYPSFGWMMLAVGVLSGVPAIAQNKPSVLLSSGAAPTFPSLMDKLSLLENTPVAHSGGGEQQFSYGKTDLSIFFLPMQVQQLKEALRVYESSDHTEKPPTFETVETVVTPEKITEPTAYPVFFLSSLAYNGPDDWTVWVSGHKITSRKNDTDVRVVSVAREAATFTWQPTYTRSIAMRQETKSFASTEAVKNKLAAAQAIQQDPKTGMITFTLRQNQSFAVGYFKIFEGYIATPTLAPLAVAGAAAEATVSPNVSANVAQPFANASPAPSPAVAPTAAKP